MKKAALLMILFALFGSYSMKAQDEKDFRFTIKTNPLAALGGPFYAFRIFPITGEYKLAFESRTFKKQSIEASIGYLGPSVLINLSELSENDSVGGIKVNGFRAQLAYKFFLTKESAPEGFYVGPHFSYARATIKDKDNLDDRIEASKMNINVIFGYQLITSGGFALNIYTGLGVKFRDWDFLDEDTDFDITTGNNVAPNVAFGFTFGYAF
jgi:hypothetical protein